ERPRGRAEPALCLQQSRFHGLSEPRPVIESGDGVSQPRLHGARKPRIEIGSGSEQRETIAHGLLQPTRELRVTQAEVAHQSIRRALYQPCIELAHAAAIVPNVRTQRVGEPLLEIIEALRLLLQPYAGVTPLQPQAHVIEMSRQRTQLPAHAGIQSLCVALQSVEECGAI